MIDRERIAILGGSFDPITLAHVTVLDQAASALGAVQSWVLPTRRQPLREPAHADVAARLAMAHAAVEGVARMHVVEDEAHRSGPSYTVDTLDALETAHPDVDLWWVMGAETARTILGWQRAPELLSRGRFAIVNRHGVPSLSGPDARALGFHPDRTRLLTVDSPPISSTDVRRRVADGLPVDAMVGAAVARLIDEGRLYRDGPIDPVKPASMQLP